MDTASMKIVLPVEVLESIQRQAQAQFKTPAAFVRDHLIQTVYLPNKPDPTKQAREAERQAREAERAAKRAKQESEDHIKHLTTAMRAVQQKRREHEAVLPENYGALVEADKEQQEALPVAPELPRPFRSRPDEVILKDIRIFLAKPKLTEMQTAVKEKLIYEAQQRGLSVPVA